MAAEPILPPPIALSASRFARVEYLGFESAPEYREYRLAVHGPEGVAEFRFRITLAAFGAERVRLQDGPDVCYQKLLRCVAAGEMTERQVVMIGEPDLASYREAHTQAPRRRARTVPSPPKPPFVPRPQPRPRLPQLPVAPAVTSAPRSGLDEGQRVSHAAFGAGVVASSSGGHTVVRFDEGGPKTFITSMVKLQVLSAPHTWETGPRGKNRPRESAGETR